MADVNKEVYVNVTLGADEAIKRADQLTAKIISLKAQLKELTQFKFGSSFGEVASPDLDRQIAEITSSLREAEAELATLSNSFVEADSTSTKASSGIEKVGTASSSTKKQVSDLGSVANRVFRSIIGFIVLNVLRRVLDLYGDLIEAGKEFARSVIDLSVAVRALQRSGIDVTFEEVTELINGLRASFGVFTRQELQQGIGALFILGEQLDLNKQQLFGIAEATAVAAARTGIDYKEAIDRVTRALSTGQTRGLVELGFAISETAIKEEAYRLGLAETGEQLDRNTKAIAIYNLLLDQSGVIAEDVTKILESQIGQLEEAESQYKDLTQQIGSRLVPTKRILLDLLNKLLFVVDKVIIGFNIFAKETLESVNRRLLINAKTLEVVFDILKTGGKNIDDIREKYRGLLDELARISDRRLQEIIDPEGLGDLPKSLEKIADDVGDAGEEIADEVQDFLQKIRENFIDETQDIEKVTRQWADKIFDIGRKLGQAILELENKLSFDRAKIWRDFNDKLQDINNKARDKEIDAEKKYQDRLRSLRAKFLLDLEEAVRERDARQIIRLIRQFNLQKDELGRQRESERRELEDQRQREIRDLQLQRDRRLRELDLEFIFRKQKLIDQAIFDREQAKIDADRKIREIQIAAQQRREQLIRQFADEQQITKDFADNIYRLLKQTFGSGGRIEAIYEYFILLTEQTFDALNEGLKSLNRIPGILKKSIQGASLPISPDILAAEGGTLVATKPTLALFGEAGPERVDFTPLTRPGRNVGRTFGGSLPNQQGRISLRISLTPGLTADIIDQSLNQMADIIVDANRQAL